MKRIWNRIALLPVLFAFLLAGCGQAPAQPNGERETTVKRVIDGDTFETIEGERVRMIGIDTPESVKPNSPVEPYGKEASRYTKALIEGKTVRLEFDVEPKDKYGRLLAYVYLPDGTFVNEKIMRDGYAQVMTIPPNVKYADRLLQAERAARKEGKGLWGDKPADPAPGEKPPEGKLIKGNINAKGEKIYHLPGSRDYDKTKPERWFATEEEARAAGFRPAKR
ncbi:thermonuclease family protein [Brevibacillus sp. SYP-B805]|uniref:thermonuclease family protein n=1 Tax=Brevibacillus sp. SYP-B805 TaxID=1578199 RepID=UPI00321799E6